ncbi:MAG: esterase-like activity of phytase family protein [Verrucomicrobiae bacterium]|nr:esterase-like activity of phytase family protein [Verrucomicrobiae bacterium]
MNGRGPLPDSGDGRGNGRAIRFGAGRVGCILASLGVWVGACAGVLTAKADEASPALQVGEGLGPVRQDRGEPPGAPWPRHVVEADRWWLLNLPGGRRFDASGLLRRPSGEWWTVNDQVAGVYRIVFGTDPQAADLERVPGFFTVEQVRALTGNVRPEPRLDCEGLAQDSKGRVYVCEESRRWILRWDPESLSLERLGIDWGAAARHFHPTDRNASFEGIAVGGDRLYVANERQVGRLIVVDLGTLRAIDDFAVAPAGSGGADTHYSALAWADDALWVLLRDARCVLKVDPIARRVLAEFDYAGMETRREVAYGAFFAPGFMEGLWVDDTHLWLVTDNNGFRRRVDGRDTRPTLLRVPRPDR